MPWHRTFQVTALYIKLETKAVEVRLSEYELSHQRKISIAFRQNDGDDFATENFKESAFLAESSNSSICCVPFYVEAFRFVCRFR